MSEKNGQGVDILAKAMRRVFKEAVEEGVKPLSRDIGELKEDLKTTNENVQSQLAQNRKDVSKDFREALAERRVK